MWRRESESMIMSDKKDQNNLVTLGPAIIYSYGPARQSVPVFGLRNGANTCVKPGLRDHCVWTDWKLVGLGCSLLYIRFGRSVHACVRTAKLAVPAWCRMITHFINSVTGGVDWQQACRRFVRPLPPRSGLRMSSRLVVCTLHWADVSMWRERERAVLHACTAAKVHSCC